MAVVVLRGDRVVAEGVAGVRRAGGTDSITRDDPFLICSATKAMTATVAALAIDQGRLSWNSTIGETLGPALNGIQPAWNSVTLAQLLEHKAGVPADTARLWTLIRVEFFTRGSPSQKRGKVIRSVLSHPPVYTPGSGYVYSTLDYLIVGAMIEKAYGGSWEDSMRERLWKPLGMTTAGFGSPETCDGTRPFGHLGILLLGHPVNHGGFWDRLAMPAGFDMAQMTIEDWAKFVAIHLRGDPDNPNRECVLLTPGSYAILHALTPSKFYEAGWFRAEFPWERHGGSEIGPILSSQGDNYLWHAEAWLAPKADTAVLILCNQGGPNPGQPAAVAAADLLEALRPQFQWAGAGTALIPNHGR
jgi:CubicO group peptidase (beta-lactamase class C family)